MRTVTCILALFFIVPAYSDEIADLRAGGQAAVDGLHAKVIKAPPDVRPGLETQLDQVCAQKDCAASRLFWYTDLDEAKVAAQRLHRPILALHMLGRLDEELSCANSRFFRTLLYSDDTISNVLRDQYVLYWHSVRPVPKVTIEMGDGRVIRQTITGNSAHYLLDENGDVLDVLPGLYSPAVFRREMQSWVALNASLKGANAGRRRAIVTGYHASLIKDEPITIFASKVDPTAFDASKLVVLKSVVERPLLKQLQPPVAQPISDTQPLSEWMAIGENRKDEVQFSAAAVALIRKKQFGSAPVDPAVLAELLDGIRRSVAADTALNEATMRPRIHRWFADGEVVDLVSLNERVYRELFLTPSDDPWLGLQPVSVFSAISVAS